MDANNVPIVDQSNLDGGIVVGDDYTYPIDYELDPYDPNAFFNDALPVEASNEPLSYTSDNLHDQHDMSIGQGVNPAPLSAANPIPPIGGLQQQEFNPAITLTPDTLTWPRESYLPPTTTALSQQQSFTLNTPPSPLPAADPQQQQLQWDGQPAMNLAAPPAQPLYPQTLLHQPIDNWEAPAPFPAQQQQQQQQPWGGQPAMNPTALVAQFSYQQTPLLQPIDNWVQQQQQQQQPWGGQPAMDPTAPPAQFFSQQPQPIGNWEIPAPFPAQQQPQQQQQQQQQMGFYTPLPPSTYPMPPPMTGASHYAPIPPPSSYPMPPPTLEATYYAPLPPPTTTTTTYPAPPFPAPSPHQFLPPTPPAPPTTAAAPSPPLPTTTRPRKRRRRQPATTTPSTKNNRLPTADADAAADADAEADGDQAPPKRTRTRRGRPARETLHRAEAVRKGDTVGGGETQLAFVTMVGPAPKNPYQSRSFSKRDRREVAQKD